MNCPDCKTLMIFLHETAHCEDYYMCPKCSYEVGEKYKEKYDKLIDKEKDNDEE